MADIILTYGGKVPVLNGRIPYYKGTEPEPNVNFLISQSDTASPTMSIGTFSRENNSYWEAAITTTSTTTWPWFITDYNRIDLFLGTGSTLNTPDNILGSRWGITGGSGEYSVEFPGFDINPQPVDRGPYNHISMFLSFEPVSNTTTPTYVFIDYEMYGSSQVFWGVSWIENGVSEKQVLSTGAAYRRFKILFDKNTNMSYVYADTGFNSTSSDYTALIGTYSFNPTYVSKTPYAYVGWNPGPTYSTIIETGGPLIISNYQINGLTGSNFGTSSVYPPESQIFPVGHYNY